MPFSVNNIGAQAMRCKNLVNPLHDPLTIPFSRDLKRISLHLIDRGPHGVLPLKDANGAYRKVYHFNDGFKFRAR